MTRTTDLTPRRLRAGEEPAFARAVAAGFHEDASDEDIQPWVDRLRAATDYRGWVIADGDRFVGNLGVFVTDLSLPGGMSVPVTAVTAVGVAQTYRRRGLLRALMGACLAEAVDLEEPVAALYASESEIYGRFGFGVAAPGVAYHLPRAHARFRDPVDVGLVEAIAPDDAVDAFRPVFEAARASRAGVGRTAMQWATSFVDDPPGDRDGASARRLVHVPGRGYAAYRIRGRWEHELPAGRVEVQDLVATDPEAESALWQFVGDIDLTTSIVARLRPPDEALPRMLVDPLRIASTPSMPLYTRILDVPRVLTSRSYQTSGHVTIRLYDDTGAAGRRADTSAGTWHLDVSAEGSSCAATGAEPDLECSVEAMSSVWLGGVRATQLLDARQIVERRQGAAAALDRLLMVPRAPWTSFMF